MTNEANIDDGGPAFPISNPNHPSPVDGMSIRDYFAGKAMAGFVHAAFERGDNICERFDDMAKQSIPDIAWASYALADAMIAARKAEQ